MWNVHTSLPVVASHARVSPAGPEPPLDPPGPSPVPAPVMIRFLKMVGDDRCEVRHVHAGLHYFRRLGVDDALVAEPVVEPTGRRVDRVERAGVRPEDDRRGAAAPARPVRDTALGRDVVVRQLKSPFLCAGGGVEREHLAVRRPEIHRVADHDGNGVVSEQPAGVAGGLEMDAPGALQRADIGRRDLGQRAVAVGAFIVVAGRPAGRRRRVLCDAYGAGGGRNDDACTQSRHECCHGYPRD